MKKNNKCNNSIDNTNENKIRTIITRINVLT